jgi:hypothetical protein
MRRAVLRGGCEIEYDEREHRGRLLSEYLALSRVLSKPMLIGYHFVEHPFIHKAHNGLGFRQDQILLLTKSEPIVSEKHRLARRAHCEINEKAEQDRWPQGRVMWDYWVSNPPCSF